jgi:uncharacterized membrane protein YbhN (UPF0104 family)
MPYWLRLLQVPAVIAIFALLAWQLDLSAIRRDLREVELWRLAAVVVLNLPVSVLFATRSRTVLARLGHSIDLRLLWPVAVLGNVAGAFTPASVGEMLRANALGAHARVEMKDSAALVLFERAMSLFLMTLGAVGVLAFFWMSPVVAGLCVFGLVAVALGGPILGGRLLGMALGSGANTSGLVGSMLSRLRNVSGRLRVILDDVRLLVFWSAQTAAIFAINTLQFWLLARSLSSGIRLDEAWLAFCLPTLVGVLSLIPLGLGAFDGSVAAAFDRLGTTLEQGAVVAVVVRAAISLPMLLLALLSYLYLARRLPAPAAGSDSAPRPQSPG